jgi:hypothetical protein
MLAITKQRLLTRSCNRRYTDSVVNKESKDMTKLPELAAAPLPRWMNPSQWFKKPTPPTVAEIVKADLYAAEVALLIAQEDAERANYSLEMLAKRVERLRAQSRSR